MRGVSTMQDQSVGLGEEFARLMHASQSRQQRVRELIEASHSLERRLDGFSEDVARTGRQLSAGTTAELSPFVH